MKTSQKSRVLVGGMLAVSVCGWSLVNRFLLTGLFLTLLQLSLPLAIAAQDFDLCSGCHDASLAEESMRIYLHTPFAQRECARCHLAGQSASSQKNNAPGASQKKRVKRSKINWLGETSIVDAEHVFLLPSDKVGESLVVESRGGAAAPRQSIKVPLLAELEELENSGRQPTISGVKVLRVKRDVFLSVTIGWNTDTLTDALVLYGDGELTQTSKPGKRLGYRHQVVLYDLKPDLTYRFKVVSTDLFGRSQQSEALTFSTEKPHRPAQSAQSGQLVLTVSGEQPAAARTPEETLATQADQAAATSRFLRHERDYLLVLSLERPAAVFVGTSGDVRQQQDGSIPAAEADRVQASHSGLNGMSERSIGACRSCHRNQARTTHPVNVYPKPDMTIPREYPTLPDGRITCASCHLPHASDNEYLARKPGKRELCIGCHQDMI